MARDRTRDRQQGHNRRTSPLHPEATDRPASPAGNLTSRDRRPTGERRSGVVVRLKPDFGFIQGDNDVEYWFHRTFLPAGQFDTLQENASRVTFVALSTAKGPRAVDVMVE